MIDNEFLQNFVKFSYIDLKGNTINQNISKDLYFSETDIENTYKNYFFVDKNRHVNKFHKDDKINYDIQLLCGTKVVAGHNLKFYDSSDNEYSIHLNEFGIQGVPNYFTKNVNRVAKRDYVSTETQKAFYLDKLSNKYFIETKITIGRLTNKYKDDRIDQSKYPPSYIYTYEDGLVRGNQEPHLGTNISTIVNIKTLYFYDNYGNMLSKIIYNYDKDKDLIDNFYTNIDNIKNNIDIIDIWYEYSTVEKYREEVSCTITNGIRSYNLNKEDDDRKFNISQIGTNRTTIESNIGNNRLLSVIHDENNSSIDSNISLNKNYTNYSYYNNGRVRSVSDNMNNNYLFDYDEFGNLVSISENNKKIITKKIKKLSSGEENRILNDRTNNCVSISTTKSVLNEFETIDITTDKYNRLQTERYSNTEKVQYYYQDQENGYTPSDNISKAYQGESNSITKLSHIKNGFKNSEIYFYYDDTNLLTGYSEEFTNHDFKFLQLTNDDACYKCGSDEKYIGYTILKENEKHFANQCAPCSFDSRIKKTEYYDKDNWRDEIGDRGYLRYSYTYSHDDVGRVNYINSNITGETATFTKNISYNKNNEICNINTILVDLNIDNTKFKYNESKINENLEYDSNGNISYYKSTESIIDKDRKVYNYYFGYFIDDKLKYFYDEPARNNIKNKESAKTFKYNYKNQLIKETNINNNVSNIIEYNYDSYGNLLSVIDSQNGNVHFDYSKTIKNRKISVNNKDVLYNDYGDINSFDDKKYSYNIKNQLSLVTKKNNEKTYYKYDYQGNLFEIKNIDSNGVTKEKYIYYEGSKIVGEDVTITNGSNTNTYKLRYYYNLDGICGIKYKDKYLHLIRDAFGNVSKICYGNYVLMEYSYTTNGKFTYTLNTEFFEEVSPPDKYKKALTNSKYICYNKKDSSDNTIYLLNKDSLNDGNSFTSFDDYNSYIQELLFVCYNNPFKWKGYYYDELNDIYFINNRYYCPELYQYVDAINIEKIYESIFDSSIDRYKTCETSFIMFQENDFTIVASSEFHPDPEYEPNKYKSWWEVNWLKVVDTISFIYAICIVAFIIVCSLITGDITTLLTVLAICYLAAVGGFIFGDLLGGIISSCQGYTFWDSFLETGLSCAKSAFIIAASICFTAFIDCFKEGTLVKTEEGLKPIEEIKVGDKVYAYDEETGDISLKEVTQVFIGQTDTWYHISINGDEICCTGSHPFYVPGKGFVRAKDLSVNENVLLANKTLSVIDNIYIEELETPENKYNFEVEDYHTYFVGKNEVLTHNLCKTWGGEKRHYWREQYKKYKPKYDEIKTKFMSESGKYWVTEENLEKMMHGRAPIGTDGSPVNLHHVVGIEKNMYNYIELLHSEHFGDYGKLHPWRCKKKG